MKYPYTRKDLQNEIVFLENLQNDVWKFEDITRENYPQILNDIKRQISYAYEYLDNTNI